MNPPPPAPDPPAPRMSIAHIMLLTLTTAISIAVMNFVSQRWAVFVSPRAPDPVMDVLVVAARLWRAGMVGMSLALAAIVLTWIVQQRPRGIAPGHWVLLGLGAEAVIGLVQNGLSALVWEQPVLRFWLNIIGSIFVFGLAGFWFRIAASQARSWRAVFLLECFLNVLGGTGMLALAINSGYPSGTYWMAIWMMGARLFGRGITGLIAVALSLVERRSLRRDWLHVLGVTLMFLRIVSAVMYYFVPGM